MVGMGTCSMQYLERLQHQDLQGDLSTSDDMLQVFFMSSGISSAIEESEPSRI